MASKINNLSKKAYTSRISEEDSATDLAPKDKKAFIELIATSVIDWASGIKPSRIKEDSKFKWDIKQRDYLQTLINLNPDFLVKSKDKDSKIKNYINFAKMKNILSTALLMVGCAQALKLAIINDIHLNLTYD